MPVLTEVYEHLAVALPHVLRHGENAGDVVVQEGVFLLQNKPVKQWLTRFPRLILLIRLLLFTKGKHLI